MSERDLTERKAQIRKTVKNTVLFLLVFATLITVLCLVIQWGRGVQAKDLLIEDAKIALVAEELNLELKHVMLNNMAAGDSEEFITSENKYKVKFAYSDNGELKLRSIIEIKDK